MKLNIARLQKDVDTKYNGNVSEFARELGVDRAHISRILQSKGKTAGIKTYNAIIEYCKRNNLDYSKYIFLG